MSSYDDSYRIYALASPARIAEQDATIERLVCGALGVAPSGEHQVSVSESSGWFRYDAADQLWDRPAPPTLPSSSDAMSAAEKALAQIEKACSPANTAWPLSRIGLLPPMALVRRAGLHAVARPDGSAWDHWLYRAEPCLAVDGRGTRAPVFGTQVEVRVGHNGQVIAVRSRWRPLSGERVLSAPRPAPSVENDPAPVLAYVFDGEALPQYYLAPYWHQTDGQDISTVGASAWSLTVDVGRTQQTGSRMTLTALAQGGSGDYLYNWAYYPLVDFAQGMIELGSGSSEVVETLTGRAFASSVVLPNGHYVVLLNVKDRTTGAFKHHQQQVFARVPGADDGAAVA